MRWILFLVLFCFSTVSKSDLIRYETIFEHVQVGRSTLADIIDQHGLPIDKIINTNNIKYLFDRFHVTIQDKTGRVNSIIIFDPEYKDANDISVGSSRSDVEAKFSVEAEGCYLIDELNGIVYWFENEKVSKIVLAYKLRITKTKA